MDELPLLPNGQPMIPYGPDATCTLELCPIEWSVLQYRPDLAANIIFLCLFFVLLVVHVVLGFRWRSWWFMGWVVCGNINEIIGYGGRIMLYLNPFSFAGFMIQIICVGCGPVFYSAAIYVTMSKTVEALDPSLSRIKPNLYYIVFMACDTVALIFQAVGGGLSSSTSGESEAAVDLSLAGLVFQVFCMAVFGVLMGEYIYRYARAQGGAAAIGARLKLFLWALSAAVLLILARCAYRVAELRGGYRGGLVSNEPLFVTLDSVLVVLAAAALAVGHPGLVFLPTYTGLKPPKGPAAAEEAGQKGEADSAIALQDR
ncbi:RTA1-domain-containing protein [Durotheca rogersii]|uniref:RTA1-domain-containing protein n=1 Tax=Durotheca rogersii TaxID=419775 RepID=UPI00222114E9|nr:RTA1-domain-containing protein [Durotheca rogersii]KAI5860546.1 RTA1-domain-containing protein [Durotheca rogersii]